MAPRPPPSADFNETVAWFRKRVKMTDAEFADLRARATRRANEMAAKATTALRKEVADGIARAVRKGMNLDTAKREIGAQLAKSWGIPAGKAGNRIDAVLRQNIQVVYAAARKEQMSDPAIRRARPFWELVPRLDVGTTDLCRQLKGTVLPADDPWWLGRNPPLHFGCRSAIRALTRAAAEKKGITASPPRVRAEPGFGNG